MNVINQDNILSVLIEERKAKRITQSAIADYIGISNASLCRFEKTKKGLNFKYICMYAEYLGFTFVLVKEIISSKNK
jgi:transcriptional regulator with XRE-family HTH domain